MTVEEFYRWTTGDHEPQVNREELEPQEEEDDDEADSEPFEELKQQERIFSGPLWPQEGHFRPSPPSSIF